MSNPERKVEVLNIGDSKVNIDPENLRFDESTLSEYIQKEAGYYDNFGAFLSLAEKYLQRAEMQHEKLRNDRFIEHKESGDAVALADAKADSDPVVMEMKERVIDAKYHVQRLRRHLLAWDKNHDNAMSLGHMLRKQMDKLHATVYEPRTNAFDLAVEEDFARRKSSGEPAVDAVVGELDLDALEAELSQ